MKIVKDYPPNYDQICKALPVAVRQGVVFVYGDTLYAPHGRGEISHDLRVHEMTHVAQQAVIGVETWWRRYLAESDFRLTQEVQAYSAQYRAMSKSDKEKHIRRIAGDLSGQLYGNLVTFDEAKRLIRKGESIGD